MVRLFAIWMLVVGAHGEWLCPGLCSQEPNFEQTPPQEIEIKAKLDSAAEWLSEHAVVGTFRAANDELSDVAPQSLCIVAWKDPTLERVIPGEFVGYLTTDNLWAAHALQTLRPDVSKSLMHTLEVLKGSRNGLHEVLFHRIPEIRHRPLDVDFVHGVSVGKVVAADGRVIDVRRFNMGADDAFTAGHSRLFAEHACYQALFQFWNGNVDAARQQLSQILVPSDARSAERPVFWDSENQLLIDHGNYADWTRLSTQRKCQQYPVKLGVLAYAARLVGLDQVVPKELAAIRSRIWQCQLPSGGVAHSLDVNFETGQLTPSGATGEATAIAILSETVKPVGPR